MTDERSADELVVNGGVPVFEASPALETRPPSEPPPPSDVRVSDDPGRPDHTIDGAPGAMLIIISGPSLITRQPSEFRSIQSENARS